MILREVIIEGFKGISKRIKLELSPTLTVIFGPCAYGKSSILEAILWCLSCNSLKSGEWRKIQKIFEDIEIINLKKPKAEVIIKYEHENEKYMMYAETKTEKGYAFNAEDGGIFRKLSISELEITPFVRVLTTSQMRKFEFREDLEALDVVFGITFWRAFSDSCKSLAEEIWNRGQEIISNILNWKNKLEEYYEKCYRAYEESKIKAEGINLNEIRENLAQLYNYSVNQIPSNSNDLLAFIRGMENPYRDKIQRLEAEKRRKEEEREKLETELIKIEGKISKIEDALKVIQSKFNEINKYPLKDVLESQINNLESLYNNLIDQINKLYSDKNKIESEKLSKEHQLSSLRVIYNRILELEGDLNIVKDDLKKFDPDLDRRWQDIKDKLSKLEEQKVELERKIGEKSKIVELIEEAISLMEELKEDKCIICGEDDGLTKARLRCDDLKKEKEHDFKKLEDIKKDINKLNNDLRELESKIESRNNFIKRLKLLEQSINDKLREIGVRSKEELEKKINTLIEQIQGLTERISRLDEEIKKKREELNKISNEINEINRKLFKLSNIESEIEFKLAELGVQNVHTLSIDELKSKIDELRTEKVELETLRRELRDNIKTVEEQIRKLNEEIKKLRYEESLFNEKKRNYEIQVSDYIEYKQNEERLKEIERVIDTVMDDFNELRKILLQYEERRLFYLRLSKLVNLFIDESIEEKLSEFNEIVNRFYKALYEHPEFKGIRIKFDQGRYRIAVIDTSGKEVGYETILNVSARDAVRMSISSACSYYGLERSEFNLLIIDEPQQHFDSKHKEKFVKDFLPLVYNKCQIILATNDQELWNYIRQYRGENVKLYEIKDWTLEDGPKIEEVI